MVILKEHPEKWEWPYCYETYDTEDEAIDCARDCCLDQMDEPTKTGGEHDEYICEYCDKSYRSGSLAEDCEAKHIEKEDVYFHEKERRESMERLAEAAAHPSQVKLADFWYSGGINDGAWL